jgi:acyl carrier protein
MQDQIEDIKSLIASISGTIPSSVEADAPLIGEIAILDSMQLVELCLAMEDLAETLGFEFVWADDSAMSVTRSMFRSVSTLTVEFNNQRHAKV